MLFLSVINCTNIQYIQLVFKCINFFRPFIQGLIYIAMNRSYELRGNVEKVLKNLMSPKRGKIIDKVLIIRVGKLKMYLPEFTVRNMF